MSEMQKAAKKALQTLTDAAISKRRWTKDENQQWTRAVNALRRLAGLTDVDTVPEKRR